MISQNTIFVRYKYLDSIFIEKDLQPAIFPMLTILFFLPQSISLISKFFAGDHAPCSKWKRWRYRTDTIIHTGHV